MAYQDRRDDAPRLREAGDASIRAGTTAVAVTHLHKSYGSVVAVDDVSFSVAEGEIFGILGPNGAGKTTTVECVIGLRTPDAGTIRVLGLDLRSDRDELHEVVGVQLQETSGAVRGITAAVLYPLLFFSGLYYPVQLMPSVMLDIAHLTPLGAAVQAIVYPMFGEFPPTLGLLVLAAYALVFGFLAKRYFRWE